ncbi:hypothetical protein G5B40_15775 [Pikeienuella piscinae]|uniref:Uncharacterized protein n=1 Tax=Pikeienuella piscinae TaxID=2748098 RepID=A0A7L5C3D2_9RHOB|nr:DUF4286 family protein [Pikeienuella piscinae]QIE56764.1 hypothetical protein G5B40_15775 [Pikeienuella piscinae]
MPLSGQAMLINFMNVSAEHEQDFNRWYDKEHLEERVAIPGFLEARRYIAEDAFERYLGIYTTETIETLGSPEYHHRLANQTPWSLRNIERFRDATRACARVVESRGVGRGAALGFIRLRPAPGMETSTVSFKTRIDAALDLDGVISVHVLANDPDLSKPLKDDPAAAAGANDWYVLIDATGQEALGPAEAALDLATVAGGLSLVSRGRYRLLWDLARAELGN